MKKETCDACGVNRSQLTETPWFNPPNGFICKPCHAKRHDQKKHAAIAKAIENEHDEFDCMLTDEIICPVCASIV